MNVYAANIPVNGQDLRPKTVNYFIHYPDNYDPNRLEGYPVLFFLHGKGEKDTGGNANNSDGTLNMSVLNKVLKHGPPKLIENSIWDSSLPLIVVTPQSQTASGGFSTNNFDPLFNHIISNENVNLEKLYLTGLSQGANSTYNLYKDRGNNFAAIIPIAGWFSKTLSDCNLVKDVAVWAFHGDNDNVIGFNSGVAAFNKVVNCAPERPPKFTAYAGADHFSWTRTYDNSMNDAYDINDPSVDATKNLGGDGAYYKQSLYQWLLSFPASRPSTDNSFLKLENIGYGHVYFQYHYQQNNNQSSRVDVLAMGHDKVEFFIKNISGNIDYDRLYFGMMGSYQTKELQIAPYITNVTEQWVKVSIPLNDFGFDVGKLEGGVFNVKLRATSSLGSGEFGIDEIVYTGGETPFIYYGDVYTESALQGYSYTGSGFEVTVRPASGGL